jgi:hypothetical protein
VGVARGWAAPPTCEGGLWSPSGSLSVFKKLPGKIRLLELVSSNSENISCVEIAENRELALWHLVNRLVPENA